MRRANMILLVLMGGGMALWSSRPSAECRDARARNAPDAALVCGRSSAWTSHSGGYAGSGYWGRSGSGGGAWSSGTSAVASVVRGGFGSAFHAMAGS